MNKKETIALIAVLTIAVFIGGILAIKVAVPKAELNAGAAGVTLFTGSSTNGSTLVATSGGEVVPRSSGRSYLIICKTAQSSTDTRQVTLAVNASPSFSRGILLDSTHRCWESNDLNLVTGEFNGVASPSAASVSYSQW